jgi:hypothetical protein
MSYGDRLQPNAWFKNSKTYRQPRPRVYRRAWSLVDAYTGEWLCAGSL